MAGRFPLYTDADIQGPVLVWWPQVDYAGRTPGDFLRAFEALASRDRPFSPYPIVYLVAKRG